jgi:hypothetical protein
VADGWGRDVIGGRGPAAMGRLCRGREGVRAREGESVDLGRKRPSRGGKSFSFFFFYFLFRISISYFYFFYLFFF